MNKQECRKYTIVILIITVSLIKSSAQDLSIQPGPYQPTDASLKQYRYPDWFRNAKFGIWAHWGPQAVPRRGDWYARLLYQEGGNDYKDHLSRYGHPSAYGYKDIIPLWKAERWDPEKLMALYKKTGAKYFVSMGSHHDNFFLWNSKIHRWNAVNMGPHKDVVGTWQNRYSNQDIRFTTKENNLFAFCLNIPDQDIKITSLGKNSGLNNRRIVSVKLMGSNGPVKWKQEDNFLIIEKPVQWPAWKVMGFKIALQDY